jgi:hypothetical protein
MQGSSGRLIVRLLFGTLCLALIGKGVFSERGLFDCRRISGGNAQLKEKLAAARQEKEDFDRKIRLLKTSSFYQNQIVRQSLGYIAKNETIIEF